MGFASIESYNNHKRVTLGMITNLCKASGVTWLTSAPNHWVCKTFNSSTTDGDSYAVYLQPKNHFLSPLLNFTLASLS
jgi:hypothetical protein